MYRPLDPETMAGIRQGHGGEPRYQPPRHSRDLLIEGVVKPTASKSEGVNIGGGKRSYEVPHGGGGLKRRGRLITGGQARREVEKEWGKITSQGPVNKVENKTEE